MRAPRRDCRFFGLRAAVLLTLAALASPVVADPDAVALSTEEIDELVAGKTSDCRKEKDQSNCVTFFGEDGRVVQQLHDPDEQKEGVWFLDDADRLCLLWQGKRKPLCFTVEQVADGTYRMIKRGRHLSSILTLTDGNRDGL